MPDPEIVDARQRFIDHLRSHTADGSGHEALVAYWRQVELEAAVAEDLGQIDGWVREIAQDRERVAALKAQQQASAGQLGQEGVAAVLSRLLALLDEIGGGLRRRLAQLRERVGRWIILAGPGMRARKAKGEEATAEGDAEEKSKAAARAAALARKPETPQPKKDMSA